MELDRFDKQILEILSNEDINLNELSERINLSVSSVHRRIKHSNFLHRDWIIDL